MEIYCFCMETFTVKCGKTPFYHKNAANRGFLYVPGKAGFSIKSGNTVAKGAAVCYNTKGRKTLYQTA